MAAAESWSAMSTRTDTAVPPAATIDLGGLSGSGLVDVGHHHRRAGRGQGLGVGPADAPPRPGDDGHLAREVEAAHGAAPRTSSSLGAARRRAMTRSADRADLGGQRPTDVVGQVDHDLAHLVLGRARRCASALWNWTSRRSVLPSAARTPMVMRRRSKTDSPGRHHTSPNRWSTVKATKSPGHVVGVDGEVVDLLHLGPALDPVGLRGPSRGAHAGSATTLVSRYSSKPATPISRPMPDCL